MKDINLAKYATLIFDCDGVILNSNKVKTEAFYQAGLPFGELAAQTLAEHHVNNGGISRYKKFSYFLENIVAEQIAGLTIDNLLETYAKHVKEGLRSCDIASGLTTLREKTPNSRWMIVSGGDQEELRDIFSERGLASLFDGGIYGSPDTKEIILQREISRTNQIKFPALFLGDSKYDYKAASGEGIDFLFMSKWSEVEHWEKWCKNNHIPSLPNIEATTRYI